MDSLFWEFPKRMKQLMIPDGNLLAESFGQATQTIFIRHCIFDVLQTVLALAKTY